MSHATGTNEADAESGDPAVLPGPETLDRLVRMEQVKMLHESPTIVWFNPGVALVAVGFLWNAYATWVLLLWVAAHCAVAAARLRARAGFLREPPTYRRAVRGCRHFAIGAGSSGFLWGGMAALVTLRSADPTYQVFFAFLAGGMIAGAVLQQSAYLPAFYAYAGSILLPCILADVVRADRLSLEMGIALMAYAAVTGLAGRHSSRWIANSLRLGLEQKQIQEQLIRTTRFDGLTGLANRAVFVAALDQAFARARRGDGAFAVLYLDLDYFKDVNDTLGHDVGDRLLQIVAERLKSQIRLSDTAARFGGDEFAVLATNLHGPEDAAVLARALLAAVSQVIVIDGNEIQIGTSIGIAIYDQNVANSEVLLTYADLALYRAKAEGRHNFHFFTESMNQQVRSRFELVGELRRGIAEEQMLLHYQPQVEIRTGRIIGLEALVRWRHPTRGQLSPGVFVPVAEESGLILPLGHWVLEEACRQTRQWLDAGIAPGLIAVNISAIQLKNAHELGRQIAHLLAEYHIPPAMLELELTESAVMETSQRNDDFLRYLRASGIRTAIDDFGTGFSSLLYLRRFPADRIKIAQDFVLGLESNSNDAAIVKATIGLAHELGMTVIAEGVETARQLQLLEEWGCREAQGFYYSRPLPFDEISDVLRLGPAAWAQGGRRTTASAAAPPGRIA